MAKFDIQNSKIPSKDTPQHLKYRIPSRYPILNKVKNPSKIIIELIVLMLMIDCTDRQP